MNSHLWLTNAVATAQFDLTHATYIHAILEADVYEDVPRADRKAQPFLPLRTRSVAVRNRHESAVSQRVILSGGEARGWSPLGREAESKDLQFCGFSPARDAQTRGSGALRNQWIRRMDSPLLRNRACLHISYVKVTAGFVSDLTPPSIAKGRRTAIRRGLRSCGFSAEFAFTK